jgi:hypothetical protein
MRNLLEEFNENHGVRPPSILGVREHIFTGRYVFELCNYIVFSSFQSLNQYLITWFAVCHHLHGLCQTRKPAL